MPVKLLVMRLGSVLGAAGEGLGKGAESFLSGLGISMDMVKMVGLAILALVIIFVLLKFLGKKKNSN